MKLKSQKGSITIFVLVALLFYTAFLLLMYAANTNKFKTISEKSDILKGIYEKNIGDDSIDNLYKKMTYVPWEDGVVYKKDRLVFDGTNYVDTGVKLFSAENINKDFEISFDLISFNPAQSVLLGCRKKNSGIKDIGGFDVQYDANDRTYYRLVATDFKDSMQYINISDFNIKIKIIRINGNLIYSLNDGEKKILNSIASEQVPFDEPLIFGAALDNSGNYFKNAIGEIANVEVKFIENNFKETKTANYYKLDGIIGFNRNKLYRYRNKTV